MADIWANSMACHPRATCHIAGCCHLAKSTSQSCHIAGCNYSIRHIENRFSPYLIFLSFNAVWALTSGGFRTVSDTLVIIILKTISLGQMMQPTLSQHERQWFSSDSLGLLDRIKMITAGQRFVQIHLQIHMYHSDFLARCLLPIKTSLSAGKHLVLAGYHIVSRQ